MNGTASARKLRGYRPMPLSRRRQPSPRILVVDDERSMREMLQIVLRRDGYEVIVAENGRDAIERLQTSRSTCCCPTSGCPT